MKQLKQDLKDTFTRDRLQRAGLTFVQAFIATLFVTDVGFELSVVVGALGAGLSAVYHIFAPKVQEAFDSFKKRTKSVK